MTENSSRERRGVGWWWFELWLPGHFEWDLLYTLIGFRPVLPTACDLFKSFSQFFLPPLPYCSLEDKHWFLFFFFFSPRLIIMNWSDLMFCCLICWLYAPMYNWVTYASVRHALRTWYLFTLCIHFNVQNFTHWFMPVCILQLMPPWNFIFTHQ